MADNFYGLTDVGRVRNNNEDAFIAQKLGPYIAACVIDGVGGYEGGEVAAAIAKDAILSYFAVPSGDVTTMMREAFVVANQKIEAEKKKRPDYEGMACVATLALVDVAGKTFHYAHVGDTRLYLFRDNSLVKITKDQSFVGYLEDSGRLSEADAMRHPKRNEINNALGFTPTLNTTEIETGSSPFLPGDLLLLCSDGLSDLLATSDMLHVLQQEGALQAKASTLVALANERGGKDNITVVLVRNHRKPVVQKALKPVAAVEKKKEADVTPEELPQLKINGNTSFKKWTPILGVACLLLAGVVGYLLFSKPHTATAPIATATRTEAELTFQRRLDTSAVRLLAPADSLAALPLEVHDTIWIRRDTVHLRDMRFSKSSDYNGPALVLSDSCKYVLLENVVFENFNVGIVVSNSALHLKNVRFIACRVPVQANLQVSDSTAVSGTVSNILIPDSLHH